RSHSTFRECARRGRSDRGSGTRLSLLLLLPRDRRARSARSGAARSAQSARVASAALPGSVSGQLGADQRRARNRGDAPLHGGQARPRRHRGAAGRADRRRRHRAQLEPQARRGRPRPPPRDVPAAGGRHRPPHPAGPRAGHALRWASPGGRPDRVARARPATLRPDPGGHGSLSGGVHDLPGRAALRVVGAPARSGRPRRGPGRSDGDPAGRRRGRGGRERGPAAGARAARRPRRAARGRAGRADGPGHGRAARRRRCRVGAGMRVLITGGAGFVGSHLADAFIARGDEVIVLDSGSQTKIRPLLGHPRLRLVVDSVMNPEILDGIAAQADVIYHLAGVVSVEHYVADPYHVLNVNVNGTQNVLRAAYKHGRRMVFTSPSAVYGRNPAVPWSEDADRVLGPTSIDRWCYATSKAAAEHFCLAYRRLGLPITVLRYFNVYGPRLDRLDVGRVITIFLGQLLRGKPLTVIGDGSQTRCFTFIDDAVRATVAAGLLSGAAGQIINIGTQEETSTHMTASPEGCRRSPSCWPGAGCPRRSSSRAVPIGWVGASPASSTRASAPSCCGPARSPSTDGGPCSRAPSCRRGPSRRHSPTPFAGWPPRDTRSPCTATITRAGRIGSRG